MRFSTPNLRIDPRLGDAMAGSLIVLFAFWIRFWAIPRYVSHEVTGGLSSGTVPSALSLILIVLGAYLVVRSVWQLRHAGPLQRKMSVRLTSFVVLLAALVYAVSLERVGFLFGTPLLVFVVFKLLGGKKWWQGVILSVCVTGIFWGVFRIGFHIALPSGPLEWVLG